MKIEDVDVGSGPKLGWFHRYPARFHADALSEIFGQVCEKLGRTPSVLADAFAGTGSTLSFARQLGIASVGVELSQLGVLICRTRFWPPSDLEAALRLAESIALSAPIASKHEFSKELVEWMGEANCRSLVSYFAAIEKIDDPKLRRWLKLALSSALRPASRWLSGSIKAQIDPNRLPTSIAPHFLRSARALRRDCAVEKASFVENSPVSIYQRDATTLPLNDLSIDAIVTSPPYWKMYDYFDVHRLTYLAFKWPYHSSSQIGRFCGIGRDGAGFVPPRYMKDWYSREFHKEDTGDGRSLRAYWHSMRSHVAEAKRVLRDGGVVAYAIANPIRNGRRFSLAQALSTVFKETGFRDVELQARQQSHRRILPSGRDVVTGRFSSNPSGESVHEYVLYARR
jgi:SAM-dependent methyltransferase